MCIYVYTHTYRCIYIHAHYNWPGVNPGNMKLKAQADIAT